MVVTRDASKKSELLNASFSTTEMANQGSTAQSTGMRRAQTEQTCAPERHLARIEEAWLRT